MKTQYKILFNPLVRKDIKNNIDYFNETLKDEKITSSFLKSIERIITRISSTPDLYQVKYSNIRMAQIKPFQHLIHFWIDEKNKQIKIEGIFHPSQNPKLWAKRTNQ
ncbi:hypothetical protein [Belliella pelovolcani]|jgi:hypothetical protein|uniref:Plasmid stabilization system protein ParE n=1 Tax=Belliella pelovolcani TaxID=529505 RepID=A0A1N7NHP2_9BACT|nr:hypothetical protein [Belliella pelovolcani]SIS97817.1 hypothetical protein SAMN05421761_11024 [Belliella pelovolcani]